MGKTFCSILRHLSSCTFPSIFYVCNSDQTWCMTMAGTGRDGFHGTRPGPVHLSPWQMWVSSGTWRLNRDVLLLITRSSDNKSVESLALVIDEKFKDQKLLKQFDFIWHLVSTSCLDTEVLSPTVQALHHLHSHTPSSTRSPLLSRRPCARHTELLHGCCVPAARGCLRHTAGLRLGSDFHRVSLS